MTKFIKCKQCQMEVLGEKCDFAIHTRVINGESHIFCCEKCAERYEKKRRD